ncbi:hypothetical protein ACHAXR_003813, partial [Thalassiosira sp. AJA248-18]
MRDYHNTAEGIPEYINMLEDAQRQALRIDSNNPITNASVLVIATSAFLKDNRFPRTSEDWEDLPKKKTRANAAAAAAADEEHNNPDSAAASIGDLEACFDNLANAAKVERTTLDELVKNNGLLTASNSELVSENKKLRAEIDTLRNAAKSNSGGERKKCRHCKGKCMGLRDKWHKEKDCLELPTNAGKRAVVPPPPPFHLPFGGNHTNTVAAKWARRIANRRARKAATGVADTGATSIYFTPDAPVTEYDPTAPAIAVGTASGQRQLSSATAKHCIPDLPANFPRLGHVMPGFKQTLNDREVLSGWRALDEPGKLWHFNLLPEGEEIPTETMPRQSASLAAYSAYDLPSVGALVAYLHAAAGFPVKDTWLRAIKAGNYATWPGLTYSNAAKYCPDAEETILGHMVQTRQGARSTKPKPKKAPASPAAVEPEPMLPADEVLLELHICVRHISRLYTDGTGCFPVTSRSRNQYMMVAYHCDSNVILVEPFQSRKDRHRLAAYDKIMAALKKRGHAVNLQILDNEASEEYKDKITKKYGARFQLVPPNMPRRNAAERAIRTWKAHFLAVLAATLNPRISAWDFYNGPSDYDATPFGPLGQQVIAHNKPETRHSWDFRGERGWSIGAAMDSYRCQRYIHKATKAERITDTVSFRHHHLTQPEVTPEDRLQHGIQQLTSALRDTPDAVHNAQLEAIEKLRDAFRRWSQPRA